MTILTVTECDEIHHFQDPSWQGPSFCEKTSISQERLEMLEIRLLQERLQMFEVLNQFRCADTRRHFKRCRTRISAVLSVKFKHRGGRHLVKDKSVSQD